MQHTIEKGFVPETTELERWMEAEEYRTLGMERHATGDFEDALGYFRMSLEIYPTAEAHTSLAVTLATLEQWESAIRHCQCAIELDPDLGNPYNDMAVYLAELGRLHDALRLLDKALTARRYDARHYSHYHRGRILEQLIRFTESRDAYHAALAIAPEWEPARRGLTRTLGWLN